MIRSRTVKAPDGSVWTIRRRWASRPTWRGRRRESKRRNESDGKSSWWDWLDFGGFDFGDDFVAGILIVLAIAAFVVFMIFLGWPLILFLVETLLIIPITFVVGVVGRVLFRRPWTIEATVNPKRSWPDRITWSVVGWSASYRAGDRMAQLIRTTGSPSAEPPTDTRWPRAHRKRAG